MLMKIIKHIKCKFVCVDVCVFLFFVPGRKSKGDYSFGFVRPSVRPSVETILSLQLLEFSRDFDETLQLLFP